MRRVWLAVGVIVIALSAAGAAWWVLRAPTHTFSGQVLNPAPTAIDFQLTDEAGNPFALSQARGQWIALVYGYTTCPDVCPLTLANLRAVKNQLGAQASDLRVIFVSVDPERDTPEVLRRYLQHFGADFKGLTGAPEQVARAADAFGVKYEKRAIDSPVGYLVSHTAYVYLIDPQFHWRVTYPFGVRPDEIASDLRYLMTIRTNHDVSASVGLSARNTLARAQSKSRFWVGSPQPQGIQ
jgi:protein SCO1/2